MTAFLGTREPEHREENNSLQASDVREALQSVLDSQPFRTTKQCQDLLRYVVDRSLSGDDASLRERIIGTEVFGRKPTYDTSEDPVVRVRAADVRKRLAQYYQSLGPGHPALHIDLPPGSYRARFRREEPAPLLQALTVELQPPTAPQAPDDPKRPRRFSIRNAGALVLVAATLVAVLWIQFFSTNPQQRFWEPWVSARQPVMLYLGTNAAYIFSPAYLARYRVEHNVTNNGPEFFVDLPPESSIRAGDLLPVRDTFVTVGDLAASAQLVTLLTKWKGAFILRSGRDLSFADLRNRPSVMIGGFNNAWTLELTKNLPYSLQQGVRIQSRDHPGRMWAMTERNETGNTDDYALISRLLVSNTGGPLMTVAGIGQYGTQAAAEFIASPDKLRDLLKSAPPGWQNRNMQAVLHIQVVGYTPVAVNVVATVYW